MILFKQMIIFFIIMGIGYYCGKRKHFSDEGVRMMSWSVVNIANPALIIGAGFENSSFGIVAASCRRIIYYTCNASGQYGGNVRRAVL